ncbi:ABC transporter ATP-binding protein [Frankia sp. AgB1.9]|uniref:ABC transporter ATP-binding protein n=1 Tax=unclassified Frankia TaxID=2632575 RepID=UPI0019311A2B|nr:MULTISPECIES: ABC transporter ATP-binding protein [unclassified Frankia]MBL7492776.1 ABC transporter ATP-binding protein [Frankia sp. AgW1.1]MBL7549293.1 ABC transporter ATP-binding protein [Frankia sp. AgB1.9]MBL7619239.1 ABC transporter ATP-binding protein [Frankia sp. AgB1.8]
MAATPAVEATGLVKRFGGLAAVDHVDLRVEVGEVYGLLGPNGAGKTTFLRMLFGLIRPDAGRLRLFGRGWADDGPAALEGVAGFIESPRFYPYLSGRRNLELLAGLDGAGAGPEAVDRVLDVVDLAGRAGDKVGGYSFGMRQRLGVGASLLRDPRLLVLDEPANGLDPAGIRDMRALVKRLAGSGLTVLLSSHNMDEVEEICDNVTIMRTGRVAFHGSIDTLRSQAPDPAHRLVTSDDERAFALAAAHRDVTVTRRPDGALALRAQLDGTDAYLIALGQAGVAVRALALEVAPLESLFFMLTDPDHTGPAAPLPAVPAPAHPIGARS